MKTHDQLLDAYRTALHDFNFASENLRLARSLPELKYKLPGLEDLLEEIGKRVDAAQQALDAHAEPVKSV